MKFCIAILVALVLLLSPSVHGAESDVVRIFDGKLRLSTEQMKEYLKKADLEKYGFEKTVEESTETDESGKITKKRTIHYRVTDDCDRVMFWEGVLEQRLPEMLRNSKIFKKTIEEVQNRIAGRNTKSCTVGLEIHPNRCTSEIPGKSKRSAAKAWCWGCGICNSAAIVYDD